MYTRATTIDSSLLISLLGQLGQRYDRDNDILSSRDRWDDGIFRTDTYFI